MKFAHQANVCSFRQYVYTYIHTYEPSSHILSYISVVCFCENSSAVFVFSPDSRRHSLKAVDTGCVSDYDIFQTESNADPGYRLVLDRSAAYLA